MSPPPIAGPCGQCQALVGRCSPNCPNVPHQQAFFAQETAHFQQGYAAQQENMAPQQIGPAVHHPQAHITQEHHQAFRGAQHKRARAQQENVGGGHKSQFQGSQQGNMGQISVAINRAQSLDMLDLVNRARRRALIRAQLRNMGHLQQVMPHAQQEVLDADQMPDAFVDSETSSNSSCSSDVAGPGNQEVNKSVKSDVVGPKNQEVQKSDVVGPKKSDVVGLENQELEKGDNKPSGSEVQRCYDLDLNQPPKIYDSPSGSEVQNGDDGDSNRTYDFLAKFDS